MSDSTDLVYRRMRHALKKRSTTLSLVLVIGAIVLGLAVGATSAHARAVSSAPLPPTPPVSAAH